MLAFDSYNPYENMISVTAKTPDELIAKIKDIKTPVKIVDIVDHKNRLVAFLIGDVRKKPKRGRPPKNKELANG